MIISLSAFSASRVTRQPRSGVNYAAIRFSRAAWTDKPLPPTTKPCEQISAKIIGKRREEEEKAGKTGGSVASQDVSPNSS